ncbi:MAG: ABC transporter substrate-binding protein [Methanosarcinaceae archaeon]
MMNKNIIVLVIISMLIVVTAFSGCTDNAAEGEMGTTGETVNIGSILPLTGDLAVYGQSVKSGADLAVDEINAAGGINGTQIEIICEDNRGEAADTVSAYHKLADVDKVPVILGAVVSTNTLAIAPLAEENEIVLISPTSTSPKLTQWEDGYVFRVIASDSCQGIVMAELAIEMGYEELAVMYLNNEYGVGFKDVFVEEFGKIGGTVLTEIANDEGKTDFRSELTNLKEVDPSAVMIVGYVKESSIIFKQAKELGINTQWLCSEGHKSDEIMKLSGNSSEGILVLYPATATELENFKVNFNAVHNEMPGIFAAEGYDMVQTAVKAMEAAGSTTDTVTIKASIRDLDFTGPSGHKVFDRFGDVPAAYDVWTVTNGSFELYKAFSA